MVGLRVALLAKENVTPSQQSSAGWMLESIASMSIGVGCRHPVLMSKALYRKTSTMRVLALQH